MTMVLLWSADTPFSDLLAWNLHHRGYQVTQLHGGPCCDPTEPVSGAPDVVIADLDCPEPTAWIGAGRVRSALPSTPALFLAHDPPDAARHRLFEPCQFIAKPFSVPDLLSRLSQLIPSRSRCR
ncbi:MAG: response regulator transcription factor [Chloroflexi bacterium]|nr:response regulator transcription factor [Chloroflexota bacterium]